ncbi:MAG: hypothetical protein AB7E95_10095 [Kiritimatiellales bacterium]
MNQLGQLLITGILLYSVASYSDKGSTIEQSIQKYGEPTGRAKSDKMEILFFETPDSKITETFNNQGICIESKRDYKNKRFRPSHQPAKTISPIRNYAAPAQKPTIQPQPYTIRTARTNNPPNLIKAENYNAPIKRAEKTAQAPETTALAKAMKNIVPFAGFILISSIAIACALVFFKKKYPTEPEGATSQEKIQTLYNFIKKKYDDPLGTKQESKG